MYARWAATLACLLFLFLLIASNWIEAVVPTCGRSALHLLGGTIGHSSSHPDSGPVVFAVTTVDSSDSIFSDSTWRRIEFNLSDELVFQFPLWMLVVLFAVPALWLWTSAVAAACRERRRRSGYCPMCNYNRTGIPAAAPCPECNAEI